MNYEHWQLHQDERGWCWIEFDRKDKSANAINLEVLLEFEDIVNYLEKSTDIKKIIICSKKRSGFIAGADIIEIFTNNNHEQTEYLIKKGQEVFLRFEKLPIPSIALIHGFCLGGGMELALACDWRIAIESPKTRLGLPEVKLGLQPGWGGSVRSMRLMSPLTVFDFILTGKTFNARKAKKLGLIDAAVPERVVQHALESFTRKRSKQPSLMNQFMNIPLVRAFLAKQVEKTVAKKVKKEHYPAPYAMIENWKHVGHLSPAAFQEETRSIIELAKNDTTRHLVDIFMMQDRAKKLVSADQPKIKHLHVIGAGVMGGDIAGWAAIKGIKVTLQDVNPKVIQTALQRTLKLAQKLNDRQQTRVQEIMDRLIVDMNGSGVAHADIIIEAVNEHIELKRTILKQVQEIARPDAIIATNTSTIPLERIDDIFINPGQFLGVHFFNPVSQMPLVEIVVGENTAQTAIQGAFQLAQQLDKFPLKVKSAPGFLVNRILLPYMIEALRLSEDGVSHETIDKAAIDFGMPMGPIELADTVGLDVCFAAFSSMSQTDDKLSAVLQKKIQDGHLGKKSGRGFYQYKNNTPIKNNQIDANALQPSQDRLVMCLVNEAVSAWRDQIVTTVEAMNAGSIFGFGFPPFRGGVMSYIQENGVQFFVDKLNTLAALHGPRYTPDQGWEQLLTHIEP